MAVASIFRILLIAVITRSKCDTSNGYNGKAASQFGDLLRPPPPPLSNIVPVPFHGGAPRSQRQNPDAGYHYQPPPPPPPPPLPPTNDFKFPAPFYKQYNFNFVPPPQPFTTTPSPSLFQKVSGWLFSSPQTSYEPPVYSSNSIAPVKKDCNPCNLVPWIPVIRYNLGAKNLQQNVISTYGPPSATAHTNFQNIPQFRPQPFQSLDQKLPQLTPGIPHAVYGPPVKLHDSSSIGTPSSTYGPPSPTHTIALPSKSPTTSTYSVGSSSFPIQNTNYGVPSHSIGQPSSSIDLSSPTYGSSYGESSSTYSTSNFAQVPSSTYGVPNTAYGGISSTQGESISTHGAPTSKFASSSPPYETSNPVTPGYENYVTPNHDTAIINNDLSHQSGFHISKDIEPSEELQLPKVTHPSGFRNSYGEPITNTYALDIPYSVSATAAESTKIKTEVLPTDGKKSPTQNMSLALANPAPFTLNRGRNIHTLQPVALPNLSVSPLPPIFNARPFRPLTPNTFNANFLQGLNYMQKNTDNINVEQSVPIAEFTHSSDYPTSVIKSTIIDIETSRDSNQTKAYRNIPNIYIANEVRDVSSQASEDHVSATKSNEDHSFESTGTDFGNDLYDTGLPADLKYINKFPSNHKVEFADLRGLKDEDIDKYRTESNLQNIDSPLLYLKPSAPHKDYENFVLDISSPTNVNEYEIYDDNPTTLAPQVSTLSSGWDESRTDFGTKLVPPPESAEEIKPKIVQIIVPYTTGQVNNNFDYDNSPQNWNPTSENEYQGRKVPLNTENPYSHTATEGFTTEPTMIDESSLAGTENYDSEKLNAQAILNDLYDVKEPPFDIIKLQHTIDDWTEQEYSKHYKQPQKTRTSAKYAKQIPDDYFTTVNPIANYVTATNKFNYEYYDHEGSSSIQHSITEDQNKTLAKPRKEYNTISRTKTKDDIGQKEERNEVKKPHIYTAASSFRSTSTTPAPWGKIQTSISPLTKEKVYVVTSKPWREATVTDKTHEWYDIETFESKKTNSDSEVSASENLPFKSPRFSSRPTLGFTASGIEKTESLNSDSSYGFSKSWYQSINDLEGSKQINHTFVPEGSLNTTSSSMQKELFNTEKNTTTTTIVEPPEKKTILKS